MILVLTFTLAACGGTETVEEAEISESDANVSFADSEWLEYSGYTIILKYPSTWALYSYYYESGNNTGRTSVVAVNEDESIVLECWVDYGKAKSEIVVGTNGETQLFYDEFCAGLSSAVTTEELEANMDNDQFLMEYMMSMEDGDLPPYDGVLGEQELSTVTGSFEDMPRTTQTDDGMLAYASDSQYGLFGYINKAGEWVIEPKFGSARDFSEELAAVKDPDTELWGYIDKTGAYVIDPIYESAEDFSYGYAKVQYNSGNFWGFMHIDKTGNIAYEGSIVSNADEAVGARPDMNIADGLTSFKNGVALFVVGSDYVGGNTKYNGADYYFINTNYEILYYIGDETVVSDPDGDFFTPSGAGYYLSDDGLLTYTSTETGLKGLIDSTGNVLIPFEYDNVRAADAAEGLVPVQNGSKYAYFDYEGNAVTDFLYDEVTEFENGFATVKVDDKYGIIDASGNWVVEPELEVQRGMGITALQNGYSVVRVDNSSGIVGTDGSFKISLLEDYGFSVMENGGFIVTDTVGFSGDYPPQGYINEQGEVYLEPQFYRVGGFYSAD